jgi:hypothetical protein
MTAITAPPVDAGPIRPTMPANTPTTTAAPITHGAVSGMSAPTVIPTAAPDACPAMFATRER